jgi:hypothetical protein
MEDSPTIHSRKPGMYTAVHPPPCYVTERRKTETGTTQVNVLQSGFVIRVVTDIKSSRVYENRTQYIII